MMPIHTIFDLALTFPTLAVALTIFRPRHLESTLDTTAEAELVGLRVLCGDSPCAANSPLPSSPSGMPS
jgi:hypothetical protein